MSMKIGPTRSALHQVEHMDGQCEDVIDLLTRVIEVCPWSSDVRQRRAQAYEVAGDYLNAISDIRSTTKLVSDNTEGYLQLANLLYRMGNVDESLK